ncbi:MAG: acyl-CoA thioesterase [Candidatus Marinimicrobia bacterium]|nr:acyl-CoA thioesterase [Candidatus Neomarinimicrobiota bacterium]MBL7023516.1 acyl-CoA thioesterase [Candidatus Neomarinimicrobiota bacterium]MBL7109418.1 acyl-CoA thioesterase [Candidatus Neomarinimicrobiota bacterium]
MKNTIAHYSQLVMPDHLNNVGTLFGGQMISWMDIAAAKAAYRFLKGTDAWGAVTRAIDKVEFKESVVSGEWVNFTATVIEAGQTSLKIQVDAIAESHKSNERLACSALITMVAVTKDLQGNFIKCKHSKSLEKI